MQRSHLTQSLSLLAMLLALSYLPQPAADEVNNTNEEPVSFSKAILPVFMDRCALCPQAADRTGYFVVATDHTLAGMVTVPSYSVPQLMRVNPSNPEQSYLWLKLTGRHYEVGGYGWQMPYMSHLTQPQLQAVYDWINQGANNN